MAHVPQHKADAFISFSHDDDFAWIERFHHELKTALVRKLRARTSPAIFLDAYDLRAGRVFDDEIRNCLAATGFFVAMVSPRYNTSEYCRQKELPEFLRHQPVESGRLIQIQLDPSAVLPIEDALAVPFTGAKGTFRPDSEEYGDALRRVYEPIVSELDKLYAASKMVFLAWPSLPQLEEERKRLKAEIEGRDLRVFPEAVAAYENDIRLRNALQQCTVSVHFLGDAPGSFDLRQWDMAIRIGKPCIVASLNSTEARRGPAGSPAPIYLGQGNPTIVIANAIEQISGIGRRDERVLQQTLGRTPIFVSYKEDSDAMLGLKLIKRIRSLGPFEVIVPPSDRSVRFEACSRAKAALLCRQKTDNTWFARELRELNIALAAAQIFDLPRALFLPSSNGIEALEVLPDDAILYSELELDNFLKQFQVSAI